jgi:hypothetical protein
MALNKSVLKLTELRAQGHEVLKMEPGLEIDLGGDQKPIHVPSPMLLDDPKQEAVNKAKGAVESAKAILGEEEHARLIKAGGTSNDVMLAWAILREDANAPKLPR